ncbi:MAG: hypothetical protein QM729_07670 [Solirubrobacterales bacterium]
MPANRLQAIAFTLLIALAVVAAGTLLTACGGSSSPSGSTTSAADGAFKFSKCMREHGVKNFPDPEVSASGATRIQFKAEGTSSKTLEAAQEACRHFQEEGAQKQELSPQQQVEQEEQVDKFAKCMREHGIEVETSTAGGGAKVSVGGGGQGGPNPESPAFQKAQEACQSLMPGPKGKSGAQPGTSHSKETPGSGAGLTMESGSTGE